MSQAIDVRPSDLALAGAPEPVAEKVTACLNTGAEHFVLDFRRHRLESIDTVIEQATLFAREGVLKTG